MSRRRPNIPKLHTKVRHMETGELAIVHGSQPRTPGIHKKLGLVRVKVLGTGAWRCWRRREFDLVPPETKETALQIILNVTPEEGKQLQEIASRQKVSRHELVTRWVREHLVVDAANVKAHGPAAEPQKG